jgi:hypothetical protein
MTPPHPGDAPEAAVRHAERDGTGRDGLDGIE